MKLSALKAFCMKLEGTTQDIKGGEDVCFSVWGKMYALTGLGGGAVSLKVPEPLFRGLTLRAGITPAPYLARHHWVLVGADAVGASELKALLIGSHALAMASAAPRTRKSARKTAPRRRAETAAAPAPKRRTRRISAPG